MVTATPTEENFPPLAAFKLLSSGVRGNVEQSKFASGASNWQWLPLLVAGRRSWRDS
jgi:hypothetical protein